MANKASFFSPTQQDSSIKRQQALSQALIKQGEQTDPNAEVSGIVVKQNPLGQLARALTQGVGGYVGGQADRAEEDLKTQKAQKLGVALSGYQKDPNSAISTLVADPDTADVGVQLFGTKVASDDAARKQQEQFQNQLFLQDRRQSNKGGFTINPETGELEATPGGNVKPLPVGALKIQQDALDSVGAADSISQNAKLIENQLDNGQLKVGPWENVKSNLKNLVGKSDENSLNYGNLDTTLEKIRNDSLRLNKGVQTEGDAQRAMNEIVKNKNDPALLRQSMAKLDAVNQRAIQLQKGQIHAVRSNYGLGDYNYGAIDNAPAPIIPTGDALRQQAQQAISSGADPAQVQQIYEQKSGKKWQ